MASVASPAGSLVFATGANKAQLSRLSRSGRAVRLASGVHVVEATLPPEQVARIHRFELVEHFWPGSVLVGRTALAGGEPVDGAIYVADSGMGRASTLRLPGLLISPQPGPPHLPGDTKFLNGLWLSGTARQLVENVSVVGRPRPSRAGSDAVEDAIDELARSGGSGRVRTVLRELEVIAPDFDPAAVAFVRTRLVAVLGTVTEGLQPSPLLAARLSGEPYDRHRLRMLDGVCATVQTRAPRLRPARFADARWTWLPFFEAYFSNFIEGTEFGVEEARAIVLDGLVPDARPKDAHDVTATYRLTASSTEAARVPNSPGELIEMLQERHAILMAARSEKHPGVFKQRANFAGGYQFVQPDLVVGTLVRGFERLDELVDPFARAVAMMVLLTEVHPFDDGNGRLARLFVNAELSAAGQARIVIPTVFRSNYLVALSAMSVGTDTGHGLVSVLDFAQRWTAAVDWSDYAAADQVLVDTNAYDDAVKAEAAGRRLLMPSIVRNPNGGQAG